MKNKLTGMSLEDAVKTPGVQILTQPTEDWVKEFEERFTEFHFEFDERKVHDKSTAELRDWTKSFISNLLSKTKEEERLRIIEAVNGMRGEFHTTKPLNQDFDDGYDRALQDIINLIK